MQAIILAGGKGTRMRPLTNFVPKPMARFLDTDGVRKNLLEHTLECLPAEVTEVIFVVGYLKEQIMNHFGDYFNGRSIKYVVQEEALGTAHAVDLAKEYITGRFLVLMGDDVYCKEDIKAIVNTHGNAILVQEMIQPFSGGNVLFDAKNNIIDIREGEHESGYVNAAAYALEKVYFEYPMVAIQGGKEYGLPQTAMQMNGESTITAVPVTHWRQVSTVQDVAALSVAQS